MDLICSLDCCIPFKGEARLRYLNVTEDMGLGPERLCSAAEGNKCTGSRLSSSLSSPHQSDHLEKENRRHFFPQCVDA